MYQLGIDFGNTTVSAAAIIDGCPTAMRMAGEADMAVNPYVMPASACLAEGDFVFGYEAERKRVHSPALYRNNFKMDLGSAVPYCIAGREIFAAELCRDLLRTVRRLAERQFGPEIGSMAISCSPGTPLYKIEALRQSAIMAGFPSVKLTDDAFAASTYACYTNQYPLGSVFLIVDVGGTQFHAALKLHEAAGFRDVVPPVSVDFCGGADMLSRLVELVTVQNFSAFERARRAANKNVAVTAEKMAQKAMILLDIQDSVELEEPVGTEVLRCRIKRADYETILSDYVATMVKMVSLMLKKAALRPTDIRDVVFVGGATRTPFIRSRICSLLGRDPEDFTGETPESTVSMGAALIAAGDQRLKPPPANHSAAELMPGSFISLGTYQNEDIIWRITGSGDGGYFAVAHPVIAFKSFDALGEARAYHPQMAQEQYGSGCWQDSALRQWLNSDARKVDYSHIPPAQDSVWYNAYDAEPGFLTAFHYLQRRMLLPVKQTNEDLVGLPEPEALEEPVAAPTAAAVQSCEGTFGKPYSPEEGCPYWVDRQVPGYPEKVGVMNELGITDSRVACDGTVGVRPVILIRSEAYIVSGDGSLQNPYKLIL